MRKVIFISALIILLSGVTAYLYSGRETVSVIDVHYYNGHTVQIIVDRLPFFDKDKIAWWEAKQHEIREKYNIPSGEKDPFLITVYGFGKGYQQQGKEDRRCFPDIPIYQQPIIALIKIY